MICKKCGSKMEMQKDRVYTSLPPMYGFVCPKCGAMEYSHTPEWDDAEQSAINHAAVEVDLRIREVMSAKMREKMRPLVSQMTKLLGDAFETGFDAGLSCGKYVNYQK